MCWWKQRFLCPMQWSARCRPTTGLIRLPMSRDRKLRLEFKKACREVEFTIILQQSYRKFTFFLSHTCIYLVCLSSTAFLLQKAPAWQNAWQPHESLDMFVLWLTESMEEFPCPAEATECIPPGHRIIPLRTDIVIPFLPYRLKHKMTHFSDAI